MRLDMPSSLYAALQKKYRALPWYERLGFWVSAPRLAWGLFGFRQSPSEDSVKALIQQAKASQFFKTQFERDILEILSNTNRTPPSRRRHMSSATQVGEPFPSTFNVVDTKETSQDKAIPKKGPDFRNKPDPAALIKQTVREFCKRRQMANPHYKIIKQIASSAMKKVNSVILQSSTADSFNRKIDKAAFRKALLIRSRFSLERLRRVFDEKIGSCYDCATLLYAYIKADRSLPEKIKEEIHVCQLMSPDDHFFVVIGDLNNPDAIVVDPWVRYLNLRKVAGYRSGDIPASDPARDRGFLGSLAQYRDFISKHEDGEFLEVGGAHKIAYCQNIPSEKSTNALMEYVELPIIDMELNGMKYRFRGTRNPQGKPDGFGVMICPDGKRVTGDWCNGVFKNGYVDIPYNIRYEGPVDESFEPCGKGKATLLDGSLVEGEWSHGFLKEGATRQDYPGKEPQPFNDAQYQHFRDALHYQFICCGSKFVP